MALTVAAGVAAGTVYVRFGALLPCDILKQQIAGFLMEQARDGIRRDSTRATFGEAFWDRLIGSLVDTQTQWECARALTRLDELESMLERIN